MSYFCWYPWEYTWTQLTYHFNRRTVEPFPADTPGGCDESTSRWQTALTIWTLSRYYPVIPSVAYPLNDSRTITYYRFTMPYLRIWSTCQSFSLAHLRHYAVLEHSWSLSPRLSYVYLLDPSDDILEGTVPVKLPIWHFSPRGGQCVYELLRSLTCVIPTTSYLWQLVDKHNVRL